MDNCDSLCSVLPGHKGKGGSMPQQLADKLQYGIVPSLAEHGPDGPHNAVQVGLHATLAALHPHSSRLAPDEDGLLPEWLVFNSLVATARNFLVKVLLLCKGGRAATEASPAWVAVTLQLACIKQRCNIGFHPRS